MVTKKRILFVVNAPEFFISHRLPIAEAARQQGYSVHVATGCGSAVLQITQLGFTHHAITLARRGQNPLRELATLCDLVRLNRKVKPDIVHLITIKPVLYGGIAARLSGVPAVVAAVSGLGTVFLGQGGMAGVRRRMVSLLYRLAFKQRRLAVIFQNPDDRDTLLEMGALIAQQVRMIRGSGVALADYPVRPQPTVIPVVVMASRLLKDKGVFEFMDAARLLRARGVSVVMRLIGDPDPGNPSSVSEGDLEQWRSEALVELPGFMSDIAGQYAAANIVCLPSYGEGLPKGLIEAAACGRAVITTNVPGCRDAITPGITGVLVQVKNATDLADAIHHLIESPDQMVRMGEAGRELAEEAFTIEKVVDQHMRIYQELLVDV
jgi:glycosyltransferase involved in cell wall biosynthesis